MIICVHAILVRKCLKTFETQMKQLGHFWHYYVIYYLTLRLVSSLNNPQNREMKFCEKYEIDMLKIIIIIIGYILNNFTTHITIG
jgi:hypothetical protein